MNYFEIINGEKFRGITPEETLEDLQELDKKLKGSLTERSLKENGYHGLRSSVNEFFGGWNNAKDEAGIETMEPRQIGKITRIYDPPDNNDIFAEINDSETAYWLGMLYSDGGVSKNGNYISLVQEVDHSNVVVEFKDFMESNNRVGFRDDEEESRDKQIFHGFSSENVKEDLINWGCTPNKSYDIIWVNDVGSRPHDLPENYIRDFIRGYFDGDGYLALRENENANTLTSGFTGNPPLLKGISEQIDRHTSLDFKEAKEDYRKIAWCGNNLVPDLFQFMYANVDSGDDPFMAHKLEKFVEFNPQYENPEKHGHKLREVQDRLEPILEEKKDQSSMDSMEEILERQPEAN